MRLALLLLAGVAACTRPAVPDAAPDAVAPSAAAMPVAPDSAAFPASGPEPVIVLERSGCEGVCPIYTVSAWADGRVAFEGEAFVAETRAEGRAPRDSVAALVAQAAALGHARLTERIVGGGLCSNPPFDVSSATTTVRSAAGTSRVDLPGGCRGTETLRVFEDAIDRTLGTETWVGPREPWYSRQ